MTSVCQLLRARVGTNGYRLARITIAKTYKPGFALALHYGSMAWFCLLFSPELE